MKKWISILLCAFLLITSITNAMAKGESSLQYTSDKNAYVIEEIVESRTVNSETYRLSDGTYKCEIYSYNKYYLDEQGKYQLIDNTIIPQEYSSKTATYQYANAAGDTKVYFANGTPSVLLSSRGHQLTFSMAESKTSYIKTGENCNQYKFPEYELQSENCVTYSDVALSTDLVYSVINNGVKENIILKDNNAPSEFRFIIDSSKHSIETNKLGTLHALDEQGELVFEFGSLYAIDSAGKGTEAVSYEIIDEKDNLTTISIKIDEEYLYNPSRAFPILIDPSITISGYSDTYDACVCSMYPNTNFGSNSFLRTGYDCDYGVRRTYIQFEIPSSLLGKTVNSASISFYWAGGDSSSIKVYSILNSWKSSNVTWTTPPTCSSSAVATLSGSSYNWYSASIVSLVQTWLNNDSNNHGVKLQDTTESNINHWTTFNSSESSSANKPKLTIVYTTDSGGSSGSGTTNSDGQYLSYGSPNNTIYVYQYSYNSIWQTPMNQARNNWNTSSAPINFYISNSSNNIIDAASYEYTAYGYTYPLELSGSSLIKFKIEVNARTIAADANSGCLENFIQSVLVHELGHTIWLKDNPNTTSASIMKHSRNRNTMTNPSSYDVTNVTAKYQ